jgi:hypothetical protein
MWKIFAILGLALCIGGTTAFARDGHSKKPATGKQRDAEQVFKAKDKDRDGKLSKEEFIGKVKDPERVKLLEGRFKAIDADSNGYVTLDEFKAYWAKHTKLASKQHAKKQPHQVKPAVIT